MLELSTNYKHDIDSRRTSHLDTMTDLIPVTAIGMTPSPVARSVFIGSLAVACTGLVRSVVQHSKHILYFVKDAGVKRLKLDFVIRESPPHPYVLLYFVLLTSSPLVRESNHTSLLRRILNDSSNA